MEDNNIETLSTEPVNETPIETPVTPAPMEPVQPVEQPVEQPAPQPTPIQPITPAPQSSEPQVPWNYKPISAWGYVGYEILFCLPIIGFIFMLIYAFSNNNINRKNFARSYLIYLIFGIVLTIIGVVLGIVFGMKFTDLSLIRG